MNNVILVGRIVSEFKTFEDNEIVSFTLAVTRSYKNSEGIYETDFIKIITNKNLNQSLTEYCEKGDLIGIKGRIETFEDKLIVVAEKVTWLSCKKRDIDE